MGDSTDGKRENRHSGTDKLWAYYGVVGLIPLAVTQALHFRRDTGFFFLCIRHVSAGELLTLHETFECFLRLHEL